MKPFHHATLGILFASAFLVLGGAGDVIADAAGDVDALIPKLSSQDAKERKAAVDALLAISSKASQPGGEAQADALSIIIAARAGDATVAKQARVWLIRQLEYIGEAEAVPVLSKILASEDKELSDCARRALEKNSSAASVAALREALKKGGPLTKTIGLIHSLGLRRDAESVELIVARLSHPGTAPAAASALGRIANKESVGALFKVGIGDKNAARALVIASEVLAKSGNRRVAGTIYRRLFNGATTPKARAAAMVGYASYSDEATLAKLVEDGFQSKEPQMQAAAATVLEKLQGKKAFTPLAAKLSAGLAEYPSNVKIMLLSTLKGVDDAPIIAAAADPDEEVRVAAIAALGRTGSAKSVPILLKALNGNSKAARDAANKALSKNASPAISKAIIKAAETGENVDRINAIKALGTREGTTKSLISFAMESDTAISAAAYGALRNVAGEKDLKEIGELVLAKPTNDGAAALRSIAGRADDKAAVSRILLGMARSAPPRTQGMFLSAIAPLGGQSVLRAVIKASESDDSELRDSGIRALADWPDFGAADRLVEMGGDKSLTETHHVITMRGFSKVLKKSTRTPAATRVAMAQRGLVVARRNEEKLEIINILGTIPTAKSADIVRSYFKDKALKEEAGLAAIRIAEGLVGSKKSLAQKIAADAKAAKISNAVTKGADGVLKK